MRKSTKVISKNMRRSKKKSVSKEKKPQKEEIFESSYREAHEEAKRRTIKKCCNKTIFKKIVNELYPIINLRSYKGTFSLGEEKDDIALKAKFPNGKIFVFKTSTFFKNRYFQKEVKKEWEILGFPGVLCYYDRKTNEGVVRVPFR